MELLVYLGVQDPSGVRAELLADSPWSEDDDDESRTERLRKRRYRMRQALKKLVPELEGNPIAPFDKKDPVYSLNASVIESDVHRFIKLVQEAKSLPPESACAAYEAALDLYGGDLLERPDVPPYRWMDVHRRHAPRASPVLKRHEKRGAAKRAVLMNSVPLVATLRNLQSDICLEPYGQ